MREAELSHALRDGAIAELTAFDQDEQSLDVVEREYSALNVRAVAGSVRSILGGKAQFEGYDFIYAAGLYDYLSQPVARRLTAQLFAALNPDGKLLTANFLPSLRDIGYMEAFMNWHLLYRTEAEMADTAGEVPANQIASQHLFNDEPGNLVFLELVRA